ncbi:MAG TPA: hypothetical protein VLU99_07875 [Nitrososphaerales archaeon]|nr:hypothetical protein [Nitrososphaerales archaeon]
MRENEQLGYSASIVARTLILRGIEEGIRKIGDTSERATIYFIETKSGLPMDKIPSNPDKFVRTLREVFGTGSVFLLKAIVEELNAISSDDRDVLGEIRTFSKAIDKGRKAVESGRM